MAYIGKIPTIGNFQVCDAISVVNNQAAYTMQVGGVNVSPESSQHMLVSLNGVIQKNGGTNPSFTVSGSTITFASNLVTGDVIDFIQILGNVLDLGVPSDSTVSLAKLTATGTKDATTFLRGDNTFDTPPLGGITMVDQFALTSSFSLSNGANIITANLARVNNGESPGFIGTGMTESSGVFTFPSTGIYMITFNAYANSSGAALYNTRQIQVTLNNSSYATAASSDGNFYTGTSYGGSPVQYILDVTDTANVKVKFRVDADGTNITLLGNSGTNDTSFTFIRLGDT